MKESKPSKERVLVLAPTLVDASLSHAILSEAGLICHICANPGELSRELRAGAGAALLTEEVHRSRGAAELVEVLRSQPAWSDVPILLLASTGADSSAAAWAMDLLGNVTVLERPIRVMTLVSALRTAIRARRRQYELRDRVEALQQSQERLRLAIEFGKLALWEWDIESDEIRALHYARAMPGPGPKLRARESLSAIHPADRERTWSALQAAARGESGFDCEFRLNPNGGEVRWVAGKGEIIRDGGGRPLRMLGVNYDITERKASEEALREADHRKDKFLATLAHELRNPLAPIRNALHVMRLADNEPQVVEQARLMMDRQLGQMVRLIDDLLDVSRISTGKLDLRKERVELATVLNNAVDTARPIIEAAGHQLIIDMAPEPIYLDADPIRLAQVFANLLNNSAKYTDRGGRIWLTAERRGDELVVSVRDTGIGIPPEALSAVFEMFTQLNPALGKSQGGLGIGLMLVKQLLAMHGGQVEALSAGVGKGAEFTVRMPVASRAGGAELSDDDGRWRKNTAACRILIADDNGDAVESMGLMLRLMGNQVFTAYNGIQAVEQAAEFRPDVILLDIGMPFLNGYEVARHIRAQSWGKDVFLIALTGWGQEEDKRRAAEAGFDQHFTKPIHPAEVVKLIAALRDNAPAAPAPIGDR